MNTRHGCVLAVGIGGLEVRELDVEFADRRSFFTLIQSSGNAPSEDVCADGTRDSGRHEVRVRLSTGCVVVNHEWLMEGSRRLRRWLELTAEDDVYLQDLVLRYRFPPSSISGAALGNSDLFVPSPDNRYHQAVVGEVRLMARTHEIIVRSHLASDGSGAFTRQMYVRRTRSDDWIVHSRLIPLRSGSIPWIRWRTRFGDLVDWTGKPDGLLTRVAALEALYHRAEFGGRPNLQGQFLAAVSAGTVIRMTSEIEAVPR